MAATAGDEPLPASPARFWAVRSAGLLKASVIFASIEDCQALIQDCSGSAEYQGFQRLDEAISYLGWQSGVSSHRMQEGVPDTIRAPPAATVPVIVPPVPPEPPLLPLEAVEATVGAAGPQDGVSSLVVGAPEPPETRKRNCTKPTAWDVNFEKLRAFKARHGHCNVTPANADGDKNFLNWIRYNRDRCGRVEIWRQSKAEGKDISDFRIAKKDEAKVNQLLALGMKSASFTPAPSGRKYEKKWEIKFQELTEYKKQHGNLDLTVSKTPQLYAWLNYQAANLFKESSPLSDDQRNRLLELGVQPRDPSPKHGRNKSYTFDDLFENLVKFKEAHGHCNVPVQGSKGGQMEHWSPALRHWVDNLRDNFERFKRGENPISAHNSSLDPQRISRLNKLGLALQRVKRARFDTRAAEWLDYYTIHGKNPSHAEHFDDNTIGLAKWVAKTRRYYWNKQAGGNGGPLTDEWQNRLTSWGFDWNRKLDVTPPSERKSWDEHFLDLVEYKNKNGDVDVPQLYPVLGRWVHRQRRQYRQTKQGKKSGLTKERIEKLVKLGFKWITRKSPGPRNKASKANQANALDFARYEQHQPKGVVAASMAAANHGGDYYSSSDDDDDSSADGGFQTFSPLRGGAQGYNPPPWDRYRV